MDKSTIEQLRFQIEHVRRQERSQETRNKIISAAVVAFAREGFEKTSTHDIAEQAGVNQGLITYHFKSKKGLWEIAMDCIFGEFRNHLAARLHELREVDEAIFFKLIIRHYVRWASLNPGMLLLMLEENKNPSDRLEWLMERHIKPITVVLSHFIQLGQKRGIIKPEPVMHLIYSLVATALPFSLRAEAQMLHDLDTTTEEFVEGHANCLISMMFVPQA